MDYVFFKSAKTIFENSDNPSGDANGATRTTSVRLRGNSVFFRPIVVSHLKRREYPF
jgi:hypothetical protein